MDIFAAIYFLDLLNQSLQEQCTVCLNGHFRGDLFSRENKLVYSILRKFEPRCEKTGLRGFRPGPTQTRLYSHRRWLEA